MSGPIDTSKLKVFKVAQVRRKLVSYEGLVVAETAEEAIRLMNVGTQWCSFDDHLIESDDIGPPTAVEETDPLTRELWIERLARDGIDPKKA